MMKPRIKIHMNKHESCIYYLFKECFNNTEWCKHTNYPTLLGMKNMLIELLEKIDREMNRYE